MQTTTMGDLEDAVRTYSQAQTALEDAENEVLTAREHLKSVIDQYEANGITPEELVEMLDKHRLTYDEIMNWEQELPIQLSKAPVSRPQYWLALSQGKNNT